MSFGLRWVAPLMPDFLKQYPELSVDLHLSDEKVDLVGQGFDAALRIAVMPDSSLVARRICPVAPLIVASPAYLARHGVPRVPSDLAARDCLGYAYRARNDVWRFVNAAGEEDVVTPAGRLRVTNADALIPTVLAGLAIAELPDFIASEYLRDGRLEAILKDWSMPKGGLYFVMPSGRSRAAKVEALNEFLLARLSDADWRQPQ
jgi:DNA-binding transcriptional LysR family regulator